MDALSLNKKQLTRLTVLIVILIAIPLTLFLVSKTQIFKGRASTGLEVIGSVGGVFTPGDTPTTTSRTVNLRLSFVPPTSTPSSTTPPSSQPGASTQTPILTVTPPSTTLGGQVNVSWSGVEPTQAVWYIATQFLSSTSTARIAGGVWTIPDCVLSGTFALSTIPQSGSCNIAIPATIPGVTSSFTPSAMIVTLGKTGSSGTQTVASSSPINIVNQ